MCTPRNLKLQTLYRSPVDTDGAMFPPLLPEVNNQFLCFADVEGGCPGTTMPVHLLPPYRLTRHWWLSGRQSRCRQQTWWTRCRAKPRRRGWTGRTAEGWGHTPGSSCGGGVVANDHILWSACLKHQDPVAECGVQTQISELGVKPGVNTLCLFLRYLRSTDAYLYSQSCEIHRLGPNEFITIDWFSYMNCNSVKSWKLLCLNFCLV
jgi:hypothetical protein